MLCDKQTRGTMSFYIHRPRQAIGLLYILVYISIFFIFALNLQDDHSWAIEPKFTIMVILWFILSLAVKVSMLTNRTIEFLNLVAVVAFFSIGFTYNPQPDHSNSIEDFCYYLSLTGGFICDVCDFVYEAGARRPKNEA